MKLQTEKEMPQLWIGKCVAQKSVKPTPVIPFFAACRLEALADISYFDLKFTLNFYPTYKQNTGPLFGS